MNDSINFMSNLTDEAVWERLLVLVREYDPEMAQRHTAYLSALGALGAEAKVFDEALRSAIVSDALFAFQKGLESNLFHFRHPYVLNFTQVDFDDLYQANVMASMPKRTAAEEILSAMETEYFRTELPWCESIREYIGDLQTMVPKLMHYQGYLAGNAWFCLTIPGYREDTMQTAIYTRQLRDYFGE